MVIDFTACSTFQILTYQQYFSLLKQYKHFFQLLKEHQHQMPVKPSLLESDASTC